MPDACAGFKCKGQMDYVDCRGEGLQSGSAMRRWKTSGRPPGPPWPPRPRARPQHSPGQPPALPWQTALATTSSWLCKAKASKDTHVVETRLLMRRLFTRDKDCLGTGARSWLHTRYVPGHYERKIIPKEGGACSNPLLHTPSITDTYCKPTEWALCAPDMWQICDLGCQPRLTSP